MLCNNNHSHHCSFNDLFPQPKHRSSLHNQPQYFPNQLFPIVISMQSEEDHKRRRPYTSEEISIYLDAMHDRVEFLERALVNCVSHVKLTE